MENVSLKKYKEAQNAEALRDVVQCEMRPFLRQACTRAKTVREMRAGFVRKNTPLLHAGC